MHRSLGLRAVMQALVSRSPHLRRGALVALGSAVWLAAAAAYSQRLPFKTYSSDDGLAQSVVLAMTQDSAGYLWFGTPTGLSRFDGEVFTDEGPVGEQVAAVVRAVLEDSRGVLWVGTDDGLMRRRDGRWKIFGPEDGLPAGGVRCLVEAGDGVIWAGTYGGGVVQIRGDRLEVLTTADGLAHDRVRAALRDRQGRLWFGTFGGGVSLYRGGGFLSFGRAEGLGDLFVRALYQDREGRILVATNRGVWVWGGTSFSPLTLRTPVAGAVVTSVLEDDRRRLWIGTRDFGACRLEGESLACYRREQGLADDSVNCLLEDEEGSVWFGTFGGGVSRLSSEEFLTYTVQDGLPYASVQAIAQAPDGSLWFGTHGGGAAHLKDGKFTVLSKSEGLPQDKVVAVTVDREGIVWLGTLGGAVRYDGRQMVTLTEAAGLPDEVVLAIAEGADGNHWLGTLEGLAEVDSEGEVVATYGVSDGLPHHRINFVLPDDAGGLWLGTGGGLSHLVEGTFTNYTEADGLADDYVVHLHRSRDGSLWIATSGGLNRLRDGHFQSFTSRDGLAHDSCTVILEGDDGRLWVGTTRGISVFDGTRFASFDSKDGLPSSEVNPGAGVADGLGNLWFGTVRGATVFRAGAAPRTPPPPPVLITAVDALDNRLPAGQPVRLPHDHNYLRFEFVGISLAYPEDIRYEYMLQGLHDRWRSTESRSVDFPAVPPGRYTFRVRARTRGSGWSDQVAERTLEIEPPFWRTWWFRLLTGFLGVATVVGFHRYRVEAFERRNQQLESEIEKRKEIEEEVRRYATELEHSTLHDVLTDLPNRALLLDRLKVALERWRQNELSRFAVLFVDLDRFKLINESHGHGIGDRLLIEFACRLLGVARPGDTVARLGGDEFILLLTEIHGVADASRMAERVHEVLTEPFFVADQESEVVVTASIGIVVTGPRYLHPGDVLRDADIAMHRAKALGRGRTAVFDPLMHSVAVEQLQLENDLRRAVERKELVLHYQPIVELATGRIVQAEALLRWQHPVRGLLRPREFLPRALDIGMTGPLGRWVLEEACRQAARWQESRGERSPAVSVNLFSRQATRPELAARLREILERDHLDPAKLKLEITEETLIEEPEAAVAVLSEVRRMGVGVYLDDFGTGFSSLSYLHRFPVDGLKIDRAFVTKVEAAEESAKIVESIVQLARSLSMTVVAEGVETVDQLARLKDLGCDFAQGHHIASVLPAEELEELLLRRAAV